MFYVKNGKIFDCIDKEVILNGVNLGGWLLLEGWILAGRNISETEFKKKFKEFNGEKELKKFEEKFYNTFITEKDIKFIKENLKLNCVRLPIHYKVIEKNFYLIKNFVFWCNKYKLYYILDLHALPGCQNYDWHSDSDGKSFFFKEKKFQHKYFSILEKLSSEFKNEKYLVGYDIMNEPVTKNLSSLKKVYSQAIKIIRKNNDKNIIFLEGNFWATDIKPFLEFLKYENVCISIHYYYPIEFTFNFNKSLKYPSRNFNYNIIYKQLKKYYNLVGKNSVFVGEYGVNLRCENSCFGEIQYLKDLTEIFNKFKFHRCYWTYKTISNSIFPTGILVYNKTSEFVSQHEKIFGWEKYIYNWKKMKKDIIAVWETKNYVLNSQIINSINMNKE
ncbi:MAG: glycoside hydrolase family 5 protein [Endomicrobiia bacterium]